MTLSDHNLGTGVEPPWVVRSEEQLAVSLPVRVRGGIRLRKRVVTETITQTVEVRREVLDVVELTADELTLPGTVAQAADDFVFTDHEYEVVLHEERVVLSTEIVPIERVRIQVRTHTELVTVSDDVSREQIELSQPDPTHQSKEVPFQEASPVMNE